MTSPRWLLPRASPGCEGVTFEWSEEKNIQTVKMDARPGHRSQSAGRRRPQPRCTEPHTRAAWNVIQLLVDHGAKLDVHDHGSRDTVNGDLLGKTWIPLHYSQGLVRVGVQSAIPHPETAAFIKKMMKDKGLPIPPDITSSICLTKGVNGCLSKLEQVVFREPVPKGAGLFDFCAAI